MPGPKGVEALNAPSPTDDGMREILAGSPEVLGDGERCPSTDRLVRSARGELDRADNESVVLHIGECTACNAGWRVAREISSSEIVENPASTRSGSRAASWGYLAAAAVLVIGAGLGLLFVSPEGEGPSIYREQEDRSIRSRLAPDSVLPRDRFLLEWSPGPEGTYYDVLVSDADLKSVATERGLDRPEFLVPAEKLLTLKPGDRVLWQVTAHFPQGLEVESETFLARVE
jgi:hypothetical protein